MSEDLAMNCYVMLYYSAHSLGAFEWPITSSILRLLLTYKLAIFTTIGIFTFLSVFILTHPVNFPVGRNWSARRKPTTFGRVLTDSFHMSRALGSSNIAKEVRDERSDHCATEAPT